MKTRFVPVGLALLLACACCSPSGEVVPDPAADHLAILEAVFRHQFANNASGLQQGAPAYYLKVMREDPPAALLERFAGHTPPVLPGSASGEKTGGLVFRVDSIETTESGAVEVRGGYYEGSLSASGNVYTLERDGDGFEVVSDVMEWIS